MTPLELRADDIGWCPKANGGQGAVVGPLVPTGDALYFDGCFTDTFGSMWWSDGSPRTMHPFGPITAIAVPLPVYAPVGSRWQCVRGNGWLGDKITVTIPGGYAAAFAVGDFLFIRLTDAAPKEPAMTHYVPQDFIDLVESAMGEATKVIAKFPQPNYVISKFAEESGEVIKALIHHAEGRETREAVLGEMRQCIAMMLRLRIEGDEIHGLPAIGAKELK